MFKNRKFRFSIEVSVVMVLAAITCFYLSSWQYSRYEEKKAYFDLLERQEAKGRHPLDSGLSNWEEEHHALVSATGRWDHARSVVLMNRSLGPIPGVKLVTPLILSEGDDPSVAVLVDRGFLPRELFDNGWIGRQGGDDPVTVEAYVRPSQLASFKFAPSERVPEAGDWKVQWMRLEVAAMSKQLPHRLLPISLEQTNNLQGYPLYNEREIIGPARHLNYVFQWAGFGIFALLMGSFLQFVKIAPEVHEKAKPA